MFPLNKNDHANMHLIALTMRETWTLTNLNSLKCENFFLNLMTAILLFINYYHFSLQTFFPEVESKRTKKIWVNIETKTAGSWVCYILQRAMSVYKLSLNNAYKNPISLEHWWFSPVPWISMHLWRKVFN